MRKLLASVQEMPKGVVRHGGSSIITSFRIPRKRIAGCPVADKTPVIQSMVFAACAMVAAYECDRDMGTKEFTIEYDNKHKCAEVVLAYRATSYAASRAYSIYAGR